MDAIATRPFYRTSIGKKYIMAISALIWAGFVVTHMAGNMLILVSPDLYNSYGHGIVTSGILIPAEVVLVLALITHVVMAIVLTIENRKARGPERYAVKPKGDKGGSLASRTMAVQGTIILAFIIYHIITFKYGPVYETTVHGVVMRDLHKLILEVFRKPEYVAWYTVSLILLGLHLKHGVASTFQSLGFKNEHFAPMIYKLSVAYGVIVALGFLSQPFYVYFIAG